MYDLQNFQIAAVKNQLFDEEATREKARQVTKAAIEYFEVTKRKTLSQLLSSSPRREVFEERLATICHFYMIGRADEPLSLRAFVNAARLANTELLAAIQRLKDVPRFFVAEYQRRRGGEIGDFDGIVYKLEQMSKFAEYYNRRMTKEKVRKSPIEIAAHNLADLYSSLTELPFAKTLTADAKRRAFLYDGPEFVRVILNLIDSVVEFRHVDSALRSYKPKAGVKKNIE
ncbi:hypothetical protein HJA76_01220 [Rhizobium bangladeshense]|uniref:hypothetical protein n=1 Tax=Rhizobium bangladeshense TaxID=1138189 RepID=UPI001C838104|nr:hypothetical protein [Rhizobium bangladeshense]MBX4918351.1 hypothetical protein [Rhizobium bangladeshense]